MDLKSETTDKSKLRGYVCTKQQDSTTPLVLSDTIELGPFSFMDPGFHKDKGRLPPPVYLSLGMINQTKSREKAQVLKGLEVQATGELKLIDEEILKKQRGVVTDVLKKLAKNLLEGKGVVGISLPVRIFEPRSTLERLCDWWVFAPKYLTDAAREKDPVERMKNVVAFAIAGLYVSVSQLKPFNPLLGETYQGTFEDGTRITCEHTSHHPPIANFYLTNPEWKFYGRYEMVAKLDTNTLYIWQDGPNIVEFQDGSKIQFHLPGIKCSGMLLGDRTCYYHGVARFIDKKNKIKAVVKMGAGERKGFFGTKKQHDEFVGKLYYYNPSKDKTDEIKPGKDLEKEDLKYSDIDKEIAQIKGSFLENLLFDEKEFWIIDKVKPSSYKADEDPLPSDCRFREDLVWLKYGNMKNAEDWKLRLEEQQRWDRKLRLKEK